jgi:large subunit ribosomal protein L15
MNELRSLQRLPGSRRKKRRLGRGVGSGRGKTAGRGHKGLQSRSGGGMHPWSEGGQMPLQRRVPKRGFRNIFREEYDVVRADDLDRFSEGDVVGPERMWEAGLVKHVRRTKKGGVPTREFRIKVLAGRKPVSTAHTVSAHAFSEDAKKQIEAAGGTIEVLDT